MEEIPEIYSEKIRDSLQLPHPRVLVNVCSHGNETLGMEVLNLCKNLNIKNGGLVFNVGNPLALESKKPMIESDLNRSFPGKEDGSYEERIAFHLMKYVPRFDYLIDIHSTDSGMRDCLIIEDDSPEVQKMISACGNCQTVLHMTATKGRSIFAACRLRDKIIPAVAFEYGDNGTDTVRKTHEDLLRMLSALGLTGEENIKISGKRPNQFECYSAFAKSPEDTLLDTVKNYTLVKAGEPVGKTFEGKDILAPEDFYPVLFGETRYTTIFGFMAKKI